MQKRVTFSVDENLVPILERVAKKFNRTKSGIVEEYLKLFLPILDKEEPNNILKKSFDLLDNELNGLIEEVKEKK